MNKVLLALTILTLFSIASATRADSISTLWGAWKTAHKKQYSPSEESHRLAVFLHNLEKIAQLNTKHPTAKFGLNQFSDLTNAEFKGKHAIGALVEPANPEEILEISINGDLPESVDWRTKGAVTPVKNQRACASCWTFSTTGLLEGFYFINNGKLLSFSEQQIVDCAKLSGFGCLGGYPKLAVAYASNNGLEVEDDYPYTAKFQKCQYNSSKAVKTNSGYKVVTPKDSEQLKAALVNGPVAVVVEADEDAFVGYKSGVITSGCGSKPDHAVLVVGYQKVDGIEAFIVKNSWDTTWGIEGYAYISTDQSINDGFGACGILTQPIIAM